MTVSELKQLVPLADVMELDSDVEYLIRIPSKTEMILVQELDKCLRAKNIRALVVMGNEIQFFPIHRETK